MGIKGKLMLGAATAVLGLSLVGAPTYAYIWGWGDAESGMASPSGKIDLSTSTSTIIDVANLKPGDTVKRSFSLHNDGAADIREIALRTNYTVHDVKGDNAEDFGRYIRVNFMWNQDKSMLKKWSSDQIIYKTTLHDLENMTPDTVSNKVFIPYFEEHGGLNAGDTDKLDVQFEFIDNRQEQNEFQGDKLELTWTFEGIAE
ncbi:cell division protein FtsN [Lentibacillus kapialis]|uniref:Cell division protein FtsN n=1 Tax=Lentibacillus kapialis TaxID=340214 RepID=A0A917UYX4_9BACI|nr:TasA family protein [Lentibacillus kapialis]GGJ98258.1 cell division protein FtsN [Lentibacillus kapialis]